VRRPHGALRAQGSRGAAAGRLAQGDGVRRLLEEHDLRRALAAGDDTTDIDSFAALEGLEVAVRVAVASAEAPSALLDAADLVVASTDEFLALLRKL
jgi:trehalose-6-phosphatase